MLVSGNLVLNPSLLIVFPISYSAGRIQCCFPELCGSTLILLDYMTTTGSGVL